MRHRFISLLVKKIHNKDLLYLTNTKCSIPSVDILAAKLLGCQQWQRLVGSSFFGVKEMNFNLIGPVRGTCHETW